MNLQSGAILPKAQVDDADIAALHRLLLGREPGLDEIKRYRGASPVSPLTTGDLFVQFIRSAEFCDRFGIDRVEFEKPNKYKDMDYNYLFGDSRALTIPPTTIPLRSSVCKQVHLSLDQFRFWMAAMKAPPMIHRKQWEFFFIAQALYERGLLAPGKCGLGFGVGQEPLPSLFASFGAAAVATDQSLDDAVRSGWAAANQHSVDLSGLNRLGLCTDDMFRKLVRFEAVDMNAIPASLEGQFDFCWSSCAFEHLGSLRHGIEFFKNSMKTLKPGGVAVHTTEFNLSSNDDTVETADVAVYRQRDIEALIAELTADGHQVEPIDWTPGQGMAENVADMPPHSRGQPHMRLRIMQYVCTSIGVIAVRGTD